MQITPGQVEKIACAFLRTFQRYSVFQKPERQLCHAFSVSTRLIRCIDKENLLSASANRKKTAAEIKHHSGDGFFKKCC